MLRNLLVLTLFAAGSVGLGGCHLYFDEDRGEREAEPEMWPDDCSEIGCGDLGEPGEEIPDGGGPGEEPPPLLCETDEECAAGCYCSDEGVCEESSLCRLNQDCGDGFYCSALGSCVPDDEAPPAPETCDDLSGDEAACLVDDACSPVYRGVDCTSESGEPCTSETATCTCESFRFDSCEEL